MGVVDRNVGYAPLFGARWNFWFPTAERSGTNGKVAMFQQPRRFRDISSDIGAIDRRLRALEHNFQRNSQRIAGDTSAGAAEIASQFSGNLAAALASLADRFRESRDEASKFGRKAARLGDDVLRRVSNEVERRPLITLAVAIGVGILIGLASRRSGNS